MEPISTSIAVTSLPLASKVNYKFATVDIFPLTFIDIINYLDATKNLSSGTIGDYERLMMNFNIMKKKVPLYMELLWPDVLYVNYLMWAYSVSPDFRFVLSYNCNVCGEYNRITINLGSIKFIKYPNVAFEFNIGERKVQGFFRKGIEVERKLNEYVGKSRGNLLPLDIAIMMFSFKDYDENPEFFQDLMLNATYDGARDLLEILAYMTHPIEPIAHTCSNPDCRNQVDIPFYYTIQSDFFRIFNESRGIDVLSDNYAGSVEHT